MASLTYGLSILKFLVFSKEPRRLKDISREVGISSSTAFRIMDALQQGEWVTRNPKTKTYTFGNRLLELSFSLVSQLNLANVSLPYLKELYHNVNESVMLTARVGLERMYVHQIQSSHELRPVVELGMRLPLWLGAPGKIILAHIEGKEMDSVIQDLKKSKRHVFASGKEIEIGKLRKELMSIKRQGYCITSGDRVIGMNAVAAPIFGHDRKIIGAISLGGPVSRFSTQTATGYAALLCDIAEEISLKLQHSAT